MSTPKSSPETDVLDCIIIGSGLSGICMGISLSSDIYGLLSGRQPTFVILEKAPLGETWRDNSYPGAACDIPQALYSFSFAPEYGTGYSKQEDLLAYCHRVAEKYELEKYIDYNRAVVSCSYEAGLWMVQTQCGGSYISRFVVTGVGQLHVPKIPSIPGLKNFKGHCFHSARWGHSVSLENIRVGVIGTGASSVQIIPSIAPAVKHLYVFQRTPCYIFIPFPGLPSWLVSNNKQSEFSKRVVGIYRKFVHVVLEHFIFPAVKSDNIVQKAVLIGVTWLIRSTI